METQIFNLAKNISTPLALGGLFAVILFLLLKQILAKDIFPSLTKVMSSDIIKKVIDRLFVLALVAMLLGFVAYVLPSYMPEPVTENKYSDAEMSVVSLKREGDLLQVSFESVLKYDYANELVQEKAAKLAKRISAIDDKELRLRFKIVKYENSLYAYVMAASVEPNEERKLEYAAQAIRQGEYAHNFINKAASNAAKGGKLEQDVLEWLQNSNKEERVLYGLAIACAIKVRHGDVALIEKTKQVLERIPGFYKKRYPLDSNEDLKWFLENHNTALTRK